MDLLTKLLVFLIHIDQETILNFFGISDPNTIVINSDYQTIFENSELIPISTNVSLETLRIIVQAIIDYSKTGLSLVDIENICLLITFIRFIILAVKYNIKTSFYICSISLFAAALWYFHAKEVLLNWSGSIKGLGMKELSRARNSVIDDKNAYRLSYRSLIVTEFRKQLPGKFSFTDSEIRSSNDFFSLKFALTKAAVRDEYRIDPISMVFSRLPKSLTPVTDKIYYTIFDNLLPRIVNQCIRTFKAMWPVTSWVYITRVWKQYCPYLIRWHWTFLQTYDWIEQYLFKFAFRIAIYAWSLQREGIYDRPAVIAVGLRCMLYMEFLFVFYALIHALFSQYFYVPFLTENTELHVGPRPKDSIYSGGYTDWQEYNSRWKPYGLEGRSKNGFPKLWYGWFGKDRQFPEKIKNFSKRFLKKIKKLVGFFN
jgi:hypothetical protein